MKKRSISVVICAALSAGQAFGAGFEKTVTWSGHYAGIAGAAASSVKGAESLYFNPAGLSSTKGTDLSFNFSPTFAQYSGPFYQTGASVDSKRSFSPVFGVLASYGVTENLGVGLGVYVSGGTKAIFENVSLAGVPNTSGVFDTLNPNIISDLSVVEMALGAGYTVLPGLKVGAAWRLAMVKAGVSSIQTVGSGLSTRIASYELTGLSATKYNGFKLGAQYQNEENTWGLGATWRSSLDFTANGTAAVRDEGLAGSAAAGTGGDASVSSTFPTQVSLSGFVDVLPKKLRLFGEYVWSEYSKDKTLTVTGTGTTSTGTAFNYNSIDLSWQNMTNVRFAVECTAVQDWAFRAGYVYTSQVTPAGSARATLASPGAGSTFTLGAGTSFMDHKLDVNGALEYSMAKGTVSADNAPSTVAYGDYKTNAYVIHAGVDYHL